MSLTQGEIAAADVLDQWMRDPVRWIEDMLWIKSKRAKVIPFQLNAVQRKIQERKRRWAIKGKRPRHIILKARRMGATTLEQALNFHMVATQPNVQVMTLAHRMESTEKVFRITDLFYKYLDKEFRPKRLTAHSKKDMNFPGMNSLFYIGTAGGEGVARSDTLNRAHWSEVAWTPGDLTTHAGTLAGITEACSEGEVVLESTANGVGNLFHQVWLDAEAGKSEWNAIFLPWWEDPTYQLKASDARVLEAAETLSDEEKDLIRIHGLSAAQIAWRRMKKAELKGNLFPQEYPEDAATCFLVSGSKFFDVMVLVEILKRIPPPLRREDDGQIEIYEEPKPGRQYCAGADVGEGLPDRDFSVTGIIDGVTMKQVARMRGRWRPEDFATRSARLCKRYNTALLAVERNNHGHSVINTLQNVVHYPRLYYHLHYDAKLGTTAPKVGWPTDNKTRPVMLDELRTAVEEGQMQVLDRTLVAEGMTFQADENGKYAAMEGCFDDTVFAWAIALQARKRIGDVAVIGGGGGQGAVKTSRPFGSGGATHRRVF